MAAIAKTNILLIINAMTANVISAIVETPAARPSKPSIKFTAFVIPTIQMIVNGILNKPKSRIRGKLKWLITIKILINITQI